MKLTSEAQELVEQAKKEMPGIDWIHDEKAQAENIKFLVNSDYIKRYEKLKYQYDILEGEIKGIEFSKSRLVPKITAHCLILCLLILFYIFFLASNFLGIFVLPFYIAAVIVELRKAYKDIKPHVVNMSIFEDYCIRHNIKTLDISLEEKKIEQRAVRGEMIELEKRIEKRSSRGEDQIS